MSNADVVQPVTDALKAGYRLIDTAQVALPELADLCVCVCVFFHQALNPAWSHSTKFLSWVPGACEVFSVNCNAYPSSSSLKCLRSCWDLEVLVVDHTSISTIATACL